VSHESNASYPRLEGARCVFSARMSARRGSRPVRSFMRSIFLGAPAKYEVERGLWPIYDSECALRTLLRDVDCFSVSLCRASGDAFEFYSAIASHSTNRVAFSLAHSRFCSLCSRREFSFRSSDRGTFVQYDSCPLFNSPPPTVKFSSTSVRSNDHGRRIVW